MITKTRYSGRQNDDYKLGYNQKMVVGKLDIAKELMGGGGRITISS